MRIFYLLINSGTFQVRSKDLHVETPMGKKGQIIHSRSQVPFQSGTLKTLRG